MNGVADAPCNGQAVRMVVFNVQFHMAPVNFEAGSENT
jgi:hypothetical protein